MSGPRVVIGAPLYNGARHVEQAVSSLLGQTFRDFALVLVDDGSRDGTVELARALAAADARVHLHVNERRLGMLANTRRALALPGELFPGARYQALGSDHDVWHPRWLETLVALLDSDPGVVLAYPLTRRIDERGVAYPDAKAPWRFDSRAIDDPRARMRASFRGMAAGDMIYGLFRVDALRRVGGYRAVLVPDRLLLTELALHGRFAQAPELLWERRFRGLADLDRQRRAFFLDGVPAHARLPWWLQHAGAFGWSYALDGKGEELGIDRARGARLTVDLLDVSIRHRLWRRARRARRRVVRARDAALGPPVRAVLRRPRGGALARGVVLPLLAATEETLERLVAAPAHPSSSDHDA